LWDRLVGRVRNDDVFSVQHIDDFEVAFRKLELDELKEETKTLLLELDSTDDELEELWLDMEELLKLLD